MTRTIQREEYVEARSLPNFKPILNAWLDAQREYIKAMGDDVPWNYSERASVGFLAAGAWKSGAVALEEWHTDKGPKAEPRKGRCDLYLYHQRSKLELHIEAKFAWSRVTDKPKTVRRHIEGTLRTAAEEASILQCKRSMQLGVLFVAPFFSKGRQSSMRETLSGWLDNVSSIDHSAIAWLLPDRQALRPRRANIFPGIVLIARHSTTQGVNL